MLSQTVPGDDLALRVYETTLGSHKQLGQGPLLQRLVEFGFNCSHLNCFVDALSLETSGVRLDGALRNLL